MRFYGFFRIFACNNSGNTYLRNFSQMMITRSIETEIQNELGKGKAIVILGARQVGKTTLLKEMFKEREQILFLNGDESDVRAMLEHPTSTALKAIIGDKKTLIIDEAQRITDIGLKLKIIIDNIPDVQVIATGSSSFELANKINEPLTGRKWEHKMFPLSFTELVRNNGLLEEKRMLRHRLVYGGYPDVVMNEGQEKKILKELSEDYLYKDILAFDKIQKSDKLVKLLQALALQTGSQVSYNELGQICGLSSGTVESYIDILEKCYIVFRLGSFSRNLRNELKSSRKIYFYDNGIRNAIIANFNPVDLRNDIGALWENYIVSERIKANSYNGRFCNSWFWRTAQQQEVDYLEEEDGKLSSFEFKYNPKRAARAPLTFSKAYPEAGFKVITPDNVEDFLLCDHNH